VPDTPHLLARPWAYSAFPVAVRARRALSPHFLRLTFGGETLRHFAPWGADQRIKLVLPLPGGGLADFGLLAEPTPHPSDWYARWKALPVDERNVLRTYTPAAIRPEAGEIDVDFYLHSPEGPASRWARTAEIGETLVITGPDARNGWTGYGIHWQPPALGTFLLVADETAIPAVRNIAAALPGSRSSRSAMPPTTSPCRRWATRSTCASSAAARQRRPSARGARRRSITPGWPGSRVW